MCIYLPMTPVWIESHVLEQGRAQESAEGGLRPPIAIITTHQNEI